MTIHRGKTRETVRLNQVDVTTADPILKRYVDDAATTRPYFDAKPDAPLEAFAVEAGRRPVFHIISTASGAVADS